MADQFRVICASADLLEGGDGVRFELPGAAGPVPAFAVRFEGRVHGYVNRCAHVPVELDWQPGRFFDAAGLYLICATHGATYEPATGRCIAGPCAGRSLAALEMDECDGVVRLKLKQESD